MQQSYLVSWVLLFYFKPISGGGGLIETGGLFERGGHLLIQRRCWYLPGILHKELEYKVEKLKNKKVGGHAAEDQNQIWTSSW